MNEAGKLAPAHLRRAAIVYIRQSTASRSWNATASPPTASTRWPNAPSRWAGLATLCGSSTPTSGAARLRRHRPVRVRRADRGGRAGRGRPRAGLGGLPAGPQLRLVSAGSGRHDQHADRRRRRAVSPGHVQRPDAARAQGHDERGRAAFAPASTAGSATRPPAANCAARCRSVCSGTPPTTRPGGSGATSTRPSPASSPRSSSSFAVCGSAAGWLRLREHGLAFPLVRHGYTGVADPVTWVAPNTTLRCTTCSPPRLRLSAYVFGRTRAERYVGDDGVLRTRRRRARPARLGGAHHRPSSRVHRLGHLPGQPGPHRRQRTGPGHASRAPARCGKGPRCYKGWPAAGCGASSRSTTTGRARPPRATTAPAAASSSTAAARGTCAWAGPVSTPPWPRRSWPRSPSRPARLPGRRPATRTRPRHRAGPGATRGRTRPLHRSHRRTPLPGGRPRQPAGGPRPGSRVGNAVRAGRRPAELARREVARPTTLSADERAAILALGDNLETVWATPTLPPTRTASSCCAPCSTRSTSTSSATTATAKPGRCCAGRAARSAS